MAVHAILEPLMHEKMVAAPIAITHNLPAIRVVHKSRTSIALTNTPEKTRISPMMMKRGIGRRTKVLIELKILWTNWDIPGPPPQMK